MVTDATPRTRSRQRGPVAPVGDPGAWRNRIVGTGEEAPDQLVANPSNWRTHPGPQRDALRGSLQTVGWVQQVMVNQRTGFVVDGHARIEEAISRGEPTVPVLYVDLSPEEEALVLATLDPIGAMATADTAKLEELLAGISVDDAGLLALLGDLAGNDLKAGLTDPDDVPPLGEESHIKPGDLFALGDHRLMCGDSTKAEDVARLLGGSEVDIVWTDPPYGVAYQTKLSVEEAATRHRRTDGLEVSNDDLTPDSTRTLIVAALRLAPLKAGGAFYVASPSGDMETVFRAALEEVGFQLRQQLVWVKDIFVMGRQDYHWRHESILYGWRDGAAHYWEGGRKQDTVWEIPRPKRSEEHPTMKPVELVARGLSNSSRRNDVVYDPFGGSGSTTVAAEQLGRRCHSMEIDPRYVAVAIKRWEDFTGRQAEQL